MIKNFNLFKESIDEKSKIIELCNIYNIKNYTINDDFSIDVDIANLERYNLYNIPLKFNRVSRNFSCNLNNITSLEFGPKYVGDNYHCFNNNLTSLEYLPKHIGGFINCRNNIIWSFKGIPDNFRGYLFCERNPIEHIWKLFKSSKDIEFLNDCYALREPETPGSLPIVVLERLNFFLETIGKPTVEKVDGYINI
jgi:hypothetical protein